MKKLITFLIFAALLQSLIAQINIIEKDGLKYLSNRIIVKFEESNDGLSKITLTQTLSNKLTSFGVTSIERRFTKSESIENSRLKNIYSIKFQTPYDPQILAAKISKLDEIEWAEPHYVSEIVFTPNDVLLNQQYALAKVEAEQAWDISTGNSDIIIAIVDTGVDWEHPDLAAHIWQNDDPINGIDDDGNGFIDDLRGWDFGGLDGTPDNDPMEDNPTHGTHVAGIASAVTNNSEGVAGLGFSCTIMPVKTSQHDIGDRLIAYGYEGILYAIDNGADIVNCSWGGFGYSRAAQEVINYAVENGVVVIGAAGNDGLDEIIYPANYNGVLSVGYTGATDNKSFTSNYGVDLDVMAPGEGIVSTWQSLTSPYISISGSSMASPLAAGLAGLVIDHFPQFNPLQVIEQIRINADNIDDVNPGFDEMLGSGRINAFKALNNSNSKSVRITNYLFVDEGDGDGIIESGENVSIKLDFVNYLSPTTSLSIDLETDDVNVTLNNTHFSAGSQGTMNSFNNSGNEFTFTVKQNAAENVEVIFSVYFTDAGYNDFQLITVIINPSYSTQAGNDIALTFTSKGSLAFNDYPANSQGDGFIFEDGTNLLFEGGLMYASSKNNVVSSVRSADPDTQSDEFFVIQPFSIKIPGSVSDEQGRAVFNDDAAGSKKLGIETYLNSYSFADDPDTNFIILRYALKNKSTTNISNLYVGIYYDWDIDEAGYDHNNAEFDTQGDFGYAYNVDNTPDTYIGMALLSSENVGFYAFNNDGSDGGVEVYNGFSDDEKWTTLTNGLNKTSAGTFDISTVISGGPFTINVGEEINVSFSIAAAPGLENLRNAIQQSRIKYSSIPTNIENENDEIPKVFGLSQNFPNPFNPSTKIKYSISSNGKSEMANVRLVVYDILGREVATLINRKQQPGNYEVEFNSSSVNRRITSGVYYYRLISGSFQQTKKMLLLK